MNESQRSALEAVAGRALDDAEAVAIDSVIEARNDVAIAAVLSAGRTRLAARMVTERGILSALGAVDGDAFIAALESITSADVLPAAAQPYYGAIARGVAWLKSGGLDVGDTETRRLLDLLASACIISAESVAKLKALGVEADPIHYTAVSDALNIAEGRLTL